MKLEQYLESTLLHPAASKEEIRQLCEEAGENRLKGVCIHPYYVSLARDILKGTGVYVVTVVGFPFGCSFAEVKEVEAKRAVEEGANELDMVLNIAALKNREEEVLREEIKGVVRCGIPLKGIIETGLLNEEDIAVACRLLAEGGAKYVKTSTGFGPRGASLEDILLLRSLLPPEAGIKASGGIRTAEFAQQLIKAGADRIGTSSALQILNECAQKRWEG